MATQAGPSEPVIRKALDYLTEGRVSIDTADKAAGTFLAVVKGSSDLPYMVTHIRPRGWRCSCPANQYQNRMCAHICACRAVFAPEPVTDHG